jgi:DNA (cytosine-5)-methyltransferase 3A
LKLTRYYASEIKKHAVTVTQRMFPDTVQLGDITKIDFSLLPPIDLLVFGSPCQDLSCASKEQKGLDGERSGLFFSAVEAMRICRPRWFLMENVASMKASDRTRISDTLAEFHKNSFFTLEPHRINSRLVSAQTRDRLYWCNWNVRQPKDRGIVLQDILEQDGAALQEKSYTLLSHYAKASWAEGAHGEQGGSLVGIPQKKSYCVTASYGKKVEKDFERGKGQLVSIAQREKAYPLKAADAKKGAYDLERPSRHGTNAVKIGNVKNDSISRRVYSAEGKSVNLNANGGGQGARTGLYKIGENVRKLTPRECCRLQTYDERCFDLCPELSKSAWYNLFGDSFTVEIIAHILRENKEIREGCR